MSMKRFSLRFPSKQLSTVLVNRQVKQNKTYTKNKKTQKKTHTYTKPKKNNPNTRTLEAELISMFGVNDCKIRKNNR